MVNVGVMRVLLMVVALACAACGGAPVDPAAPGAATVLVSPTIVESASPSASRGAASASAASSRDGDWLVFEWFAGRSVKDVMLMRPDGSERHAVASDIEPALHHTHPTWSPDGSAIAFDVGELYDGVSIWTVGIDGTDAAKLIGPDDRCPLGVAHPSYSPDGRRLMYACQDGASGTSPDVHETLEILDLASGERTAVVTLEGQQEIVWPTWSRDGETALFTVNTWAEDLTTQVGSFIATVPIGGGPLVPLVDADSWATEARWSPTQDLIVFGTHGYDDKSMATRSTIEAIRPDGSGRQTIWPGTDTAAGRVGSPRWSLDGEYLIVSVATGEVGIGDIHPATLSLDGQLSRIAAPASGVHWSPRPGQ